MISLSRRSAIRSQVEVLKSKLEEAKSLLLFSKKNLAEISSHLCYSSQAYFQNVFKKKYGMTPLQYRNTKRRIE